MFPAHPYDGQPFTTALGVPYSFDETRNSWMILTFNGSGYSGYSGYSGIDGASGYSGYSGEPGSAVYKGDSGYSGYSGISGYSGYSGYSGISGDGGTSTFSWVISAPVTGGIPGPQLYEARTINRISSFVTSATSATFNIEDRTTPGSAGTDIMSPDQVATTSGTNTTSFSHGSIPVNHYLWLDIFATSGTPAILEVSITTSKT